MSTYLISPFHFPTSVVLVDDHPVFLENLSLNFGQSLAYHLFNKPGNALQFLNREIVSDEDNVLSMYSQRQDFNEKDHVVNLKLDSIYRKVYDKNRFSQVSIVVADYNMPDMDGLTFCNSIQNKNIRKILLTGKADQNMAVKALNEKAIDFFIKKQDPNTIPKLLSAVQQLQKSYFETIENLLVDALAVGSYKFLKDPELSRYFGKIHQDLKIVEHYLISSPDRILMLDNKAQAYSLLVYTKSALEAQCQVAKAQDAPAGLIQALESAKYVPYFYKKSGYYDPIYTEWTQYIHPATRINGQEPYWCAVVDETTFLDSAHIFSQKYYIDALDSVKFTDEK